MSEYLETLFWLLLVSGIWFGAITQLRLNRKDKDLDDFVKYKR